jgi:hypothetical protein
MIPSEHTSESPIGIPAISDDRGDPQDLRRVPSSKVDKQMGAGRGPDSEAY